MKLGECSMKRWMLMVAVALALPALAQDQSGTGGLTYRKGDPFLFCHQGQDPKTLPCWLPTPPYTGAWINAPYCEPDDEYGKAWTSDDYESLSQYQQICPKAITSGDWKGSGDPSTSPMSH